MPVFSVNPLPPNDLPDDLPDDLSALTAANEREIAMTETAAHCDLDSKYALIASDREEYERNGHILLRGVASPAEVVASRSAILDCVRRHTGQVRPLAERDTYGKAFLQVPNLYQQYWPLDGVKTITLWMPLVNADESLGTMRFASGSQHLGYLGALPISDASEAELAEFGADRGFPVTRSGAMTAGDATFHSGWTLHGAPGNSSDTTREVMTIIYFEDGARISTPDSPSREGDRRGCFPGLKPGDLAASSINPVVYQRREDG